MLKKENKRGTRLMLNIEKYKGEIKERMKKPYNLMDLLERLMAEKTGRDFEDIYITNVFDWLSEEYKKPILDEVEKKYLNAVIRPFRCDVKFISKEITFIEDRYRIKIITKQSITKQSFDGACQECTILPSFETDMYKGMELGRKYTLEELGL
jgi:hypothetical protein